VNAACDVLVVDDEAVVREAIGLVLRDAGLAVVAVPDIETALGHPALAACRLAICDLMLPGVSGAEAVAALRGARPDLPVLVITGYATPAHAERVRAAGAIEFLPKPFDDVELLNLVRRALAGAEAGEETPS
jgi:DNA-binding NtrC family response regulator